MTQPELAKKLRTSKQFISDMENGRKPISKRMAKELANLFDVSVGLSEIFSGTLQTRSERCQIHWIKGNAVLFNREDNSRLWKISVACTY